MNNKIAIESLSMDLYRVALGYHRGSTKMAERFREEALKRLREIDREKLRSKFYTTLKKIDQCLTAGDEDHIAEDALMYSTICRNYAKHYF